MKGTLNALLGLALIVSYGSAMAQNSNASKSGYRSQALESQVYRGLASFAAGDGHTVDPNSVEININRHGVTAIAPYYTDMLEIDLSTDFKLGAVYYEGSRASSFSLPNGHYTLVLSKPAHNRVELQYHDARGQIVHVTPAKIDVMSREGYGAVEASVRASGVIDQPVVSSAHGSCWVFYSNGYQGHGYCWITPIEEPAQ